MTPDDRKKSFDSVPVQEQSFQPHYFLWVLRRQNDSLSLCVRRRSRCRPSVNDSGRRAAPRPQLAYRCFTPTSLLTLPAMTRHPSGANEAWSRRSSCVTACCGPTPTSHSGYTTQTRPPTTHPPLHLRLSPPASSYLSSCCRESWRGCFDMK